MTCKIVCNWAESSRYSQSAAERSGKLMDTRLCLKVKFLRLPTSLSDLLNGLKSLFFQLSSFIFLLAWKIDGNWNGMEQLMQRTRGSRAISRQATETPISNFFYIILYGSREILLITPFKTIINSQCDTLNLNFFLSKRARSSSLAVLSPVLFPESRNLTSSDAKTKLWKMCKQKQRSFSLSCALSPSSSRH